MACVFFVIIGFIWLKHMIESVMNPKVIWPYNAYTWVISMLIQIRNQCVGTAVRMFHLHICARGYVHGLRKSADKKDVSTIFNVLPGSCWSAVIK